MTWHTMVLSEADNVNPGFIRRYYALIDVSMPHPGTTWRWHQVNVKGSFVGSASASFTSEDDAMADALRTLDGDKWEQ